MKNIFTFSKNNKHFAPKGFTLIELIVVIGIITVISALSIFNSSKLNSTVLLSNTAYEIGLIVRDAQVSGLGAKVLSTQGEAGIATTSNQGVYFDLATPDKIIFFADLNNSNSYNEAGGEVNQVFNIENKRAGEILSICKIDIINNNCTLQDLTILFKRPNPEAYFYITESDRKEEHFGSVAVNIGFTGGECKSIIIYKTGAVQIDKSFCPTTN